MAPRNYVVTVIEQRLYTCFFVRTLIFLALVRSIDPSKKKTKNKKKKKKKNMQRPVTRHVTTSGAQTKIRNRSNCRKNPEGKPEGKSTRQGDFADRRSFPFSFSLFLSPGRGNTGAQAITSKRGISVGRFSVKREEGWVPGSEEGNTFGTVRRHRSRGKLSARVSRGG